MSEFLNQKVEPLPDGFDAMGKPVPFFRKQNGYDHCKAMGLSEAESFAAVNAVSEQLERDKPYEAMAAGMRYLYLTGVYRLFAVLLVSTKEGA